jgi:hypothetical protein
MSPDVHSSQKAKSPQELRLVKGLTKAAFELFDKGEKVYIPDARGRIDEHRPASRQDVLAAVSAGTFRSFRHRIGDWPPEATDVHIREWHDENPGHVTEASGYVYQIYGEGGFTVPDAPRDWLQAQDEEMMEALIAGRYLPVANNVIPLQAEPVKDARPAKVPQRRERKKAGGMKAAGPKAGVSPPPSTSGPPGPSPELGTGVTAGLDLASLRLSQDYTQAAGVEKLLTTVPVRKPHKTEFVRVHPEKHFDTMILDLKEERETYLLAPDLRGSLSGIAVPVSLRLALNRLGVLFLWPLRLPGEDGRTNVWHESSWEAANLAKSRWVSVRANMPLGAYEIFRGDEALSEPQWPDKSLEEIMNIAFRGRLISDPGHPVIKRLRGQV